MSASTIKLRRSSVAGNKPTVDQLALGEVAINTHDGAMFFKRDKNGELSIVELGGSAVAENVFYVSKSGDDSNDGTSLDRAFLTIDKALEMAAQRRADAGLDSDGAQESIIETKTKRDLQYYIDGAKYDIALGSTFNQVFQGRAGSYTKGIDEVITSIEWMKAKFANTLTTNLSTGEPAPLGEFILRQTNQIPAKSRSDDYWDELTDIIQNGRNNADDDNDGSLEANDYPNTTLASNGYYGSASIEDDATRSRDLLLNNKLFLAEEVSQYIEKQVAEAPTWYNFNYNEAKCNRDTKFLVDAVRYDFLFGTNYRSVASGKRYYSGAASTVINDQKPQTVGALRKAKEFTLNTITNDSVDSEAGLLWDEIIQIIDSGTSVADAYQYTTLLGGTAPWPTGRDSNFGYAGDQILTNKGFIQDEIIAWINKQVTEQNAPFSSSFAYNDSLCARDVGLIIDAVLYDLQYGGNLQSYDAALAYYVDGVAQYGNGEQEETIAALGRLKTVLGQIAKEETVTLSDSTGWYTGRNGSLQLTTGDAASDSAADFAEARIQDVIYYLEQGGVNKPTKFYPDTTWADSTLEAQFDLLNDSGQQVIADNTVAWIGDQISLADGFYNYNYDSNRQTKSKRDTRFTLEALTYDATYLGNAASYDNAYFFQTNGIPQIPETDRLVCAAAMDRLSVIVGNVLAGDSVELSDSAGAYTYSQSFGTYPSTAKITELSGLISMTSDVIEGGVSYLPSSRITPDLDSDVNFDSNSLNDGLVEYKAIFDTITLNDSDYINSATSGTNNEGVITYLDRVYPLLFDVGDRYQDVLDRPEIATTIYLKTGDYTINNPVEVPKNVSLIGDNLKNCSIRPANKTSDMFYVNNNCYISDVTFRDHLQPAAVIAWDPTGTPDTNIIVNSPYIRNCTSITGPDLSRNDDGTYVYPDASDSSLPAQGGDGIRNDGSKVGGIRSIVVDSFTQINQGGKGVYLLNRGYCQLVSVFTVYCDVGFLAENGGFASITNSNSSFGNIALKAVGVSDTLYSCNVDGNQDRLDNIITLKNMDQLPNISDAVFFGSTLPSDGTLATDSDFYYTVDSASYDSATGTGSIKLLENVEVNIPDNSSVRFFQRSALSSSGHTFEWIGTGTDVRTALPYRGGVPNQADEVIQDSNRGGLCFVTSTDQKGDFRVGEGFLIQRSTGTIEGEAFDRSLFARITPFSLALED